MGTVADPDVLSWSGAKLRHWLGSLLSWVGLGTAAAASHRLWKTLKTQLSFFFLK